MTNPPGSTHDAVAALVDDLRRRVPPGHDAARLDAIASRLRGPLRVAIAGRLKAGKSTLLNALVGERLARTDAAECTRVVSRYRHGLGYEVAAELASGGRRPLRFRREDGALDVDLGDLTAADLRALDVSWPAATLTRLTLIDTPGLASLDVETSRRTTDLLGGDGEHGHDADAVVYLMRHLHRSDVDFLEAFLDRSVPGASPVSSVAVLSRADEIGGGRPDALESAARIADRYAHDGTVRSLVSEVVPLAGLLAETGLTLREEEAAALRVLASTDDEELEQLLTSADHALEAHRSALTVEHRRHLVARLGMYGLRFAVAAVRDGATTAATLGPILVERSGLPALRATLEERFLPRARLLQVRTAIAALRSFAGDVRGGDPALAEWILRGVEQIESSAVELAQLRAAHLVATGQARVAEARRPDLELLLLAPTPARALGLAPDVGAAELARAALAAAGTWRSLASDLLAGPAQIEVYETAARRAEGIYASCRTMV